MKFTVKQKSRLPKQVNSIARNAARKLHMDLLISILPPNKVSKKLNKHMLGH
jgi:hypothetical protein